MISIIRASIGLMSIACEIINSNMKLYKNILENPSEIQDYLVNDQWVKKNFPKREFYLVKSEQEYVGMASFQKLNDFAYIGYFHIKFPKYQKGYGTQLMKFLEMRTKTEKLNKIRLFTHKNASWAIKYKKKMGVRLLEDDQQTIDHLDSGLLRQFHKKNHILFKQY